MEHFGYGVQIDQRLVTEIGLGASVADVENFGEGTEALEKVVGLSVALFVTLEQVDLHLDCVDFLRATARPALPLVFLLPLLNVLHVEADALAQLDEGLGHVGGDVTNDDAANGHVND